MPPSGFNSHAVKGALQFIKGCYKDLLQKVEDGKHDSIEDAIEYELKQIESALSQIHIDSEGVLVSKG